MSESGTLAIGVACGASTTVLILGGGSSVALSVVRYLDPAVKGARISAMVSVGSCAAMLAWGC